jgi:hypothetical protein
MYPETGELAFAIGGRNRMISMGCFFRFVYQNAVGAGKKPRPLVAQGCVPYRVACLPRPGPELTILADGLEYSGGEGVGAQPNFLLTEQPLCGI